jgi:hypothetical protein
MTEPRNPPGAPADPELNALAERVEAAVLEATRDLKGYYNREINAQLAHSEERIEQRLAGVEADLQGIGIKLTAIRDELHQSLRDQTLRLAAAVAGIVAFGIAALLLTTRTWG